LRPLRLELEGFGPYRERQAVDFSDVELFAITGPTGSGKSTLLDAVAFALYGLVPRVGRSVATLKHPAASEARVALTFQVGQKVYRVERVRGRRSEGRLFELSPAGERLVPSETLEALNGLLEDLLGLSYEAFTRALLLPQGEFDRFLKGEAKERRRILLDLFELSRLERARERAAGERARLLEEKGRLEGELLGLKEVTLEALEAREKALEEVAQGVARLEEEVRRLEKGLKEAEDLLERLEERHLLEAQRARLLGEASRMAALRERLAKAQEAERALPLWEDLRTKEKALAATREEAARLEAKVRELEEKRRALAFDPKALEALRQALLEAQGLKALEALWRRVGVKDHPAPRLDLEALEALLEEEGRLREEEASLAAWAEALAHLRARQGELAALQAELAQLQEEGKRVREEKEALERALKGATAFRLREELRALEAEAEALEGERARLLGELKALRQEERRLGLLAFHDLLEPGKPCPLCGGLVHALPPKPKGEDLRERVAALEGKDRDLLLRLGKLRERREALLREDAALGAEPSPGDPEALRAILEEKKALLEELRGRYREASGRHKALEREVGELEAKAKRLAAGRSGAPEALLQGVRARLAVLREEKGALGAGLFRHLMERTGGLGLAEHLGRLQAALREMENKEAQEKRLSRELEEAQRALSALAARQEEQAKALAEARERVGGLLPEAEARASHLAPEEKRALEERLQAHEKEMAEVEARLQALPPLPPLSLEEAEARARKEREALGKAQGALRALEGRRAVLEAERERLREGLKRRRELEGRLAEVAKEVGLWEKLAQDLQAHNFPAYLLGLRQRNLVERANELLNTLSGGRYRLRALGDEYQVHDLWHAGEARPVKTLSGGEGFLASLSLALALSEELSRGRLGALFLDEGFGTLDPETLELVAGVLEALPTRGRLVGIVTHVEVLAERLPARLVVRKHPTGSRVEWA
jgi:exonuclease SbcC